MSERNPPSPVDIVFTAVSPALIMLMVGSLVFFLITVLPTGDYKERLLYTTFFFVFGAVLVARIAIQLDAARASVYGLGLAVVTFLAMTAYVDYPSGTTLKSVGWLVNLGLMGLIWWSAHKLTWDCTHVDDNRDASGRGLLAAAGLTESNDDSVSREPTASADPSSISREPTASAESPSSKKKRKKKTPQPSAFSAWTTRWWKHREGQKDKPHTPGVWVIYFALAALPLFAVGQSLIPPEDGDRRRATFLQMAVYVGSALGLLATTSLLGLRRYLRQRKAKMPASLTAGWLGLGAVLIAVFLVVGAFLPRPYSEVPWFGLPQTESDKRNASQYAQRGDSAGKGEGASGDKAEKGDGASSDKEGGSGKGKGKGQGKGDDKNGSGGDSRDKNKDGDGPNAKADPQGNKAGDGKSERQSSGRRTPETKLGSALQKIGGALKWLVIAIVVALVIAAIALAILRYLAPFTDWARNLLDNLKNWWASLWGRKKKARPATVEVAMPTGPLRPPPFHQYSNPFVDGSAERRQPAELIGYTFEALDAWAWDRDNGRRAADTPLEFSERLGSDFPDFAAHLRRMANLYARMAYAEGNVPKEAVPFLEQFWDEMVHGEHVKTEAY